MPRKMAAVKRHGLTGQLSGGLADSLHKHAERDAYAGTAGAAGEGARSAAERIPTSELPNAVNALKGALLQGGLEMMNSKDGGGAPARVARWRSTRWAPSARLLHPSRTCVRA